MRCRYLLLPLLSVLGLPVGADAQFRSNGHRGLSNTWQITVYSSGIDQPILRESSIEGGDAVAESGVGGKDTVVTVAVDAGRGDLTLFTITLAPRSPSAYPAEGT